MEYILRYCTLVYTKLSELYKTHITHLIFRIENYGLEVNLLWILAHIRSVGNELANSFAKYTVLQKNIVDLNVKISKSNVKNIKKLYIKEKWQERWDRGDNARFYYSIK